MPRKKLFTPTKLAAWILWEIDETALRKDPIVEPSLEKILYLLYWIQAWSVTFDSAPIMQGEIKATPKEISIEKLRQLTERDQKNLPKLNEAQETTLAFVVRNYSRLTEAKLKSLITRTKPWKEARKSRGRVITHESMKRYCSSIT